MIRGASHLHKFYISLGIATLQGIEATYSQNGQNILIKTEADMDYNSVDECITINLSQDDTLKFAPVGIPATVKESLVTIQFKFLDVNGNVYVSQPIRERLYDVLHDEVMV